MKIGHLLIAISALMLLLQPAGAQVTLEKLRNSPELMTGLFHPYPASPDADTPAPAGFKPFYISHYGRHGSRFETSESLVTLAPSYFKKLREAGLLTAKGEALADFLQGIADESAGRWGELTELGAKEHREIADRLYARFTPVFQDRKRADVVCTASVVTRCVVSMASSTGELRALAPELRFSYRTGERYQSFMRNTQTSQKQNLRTNASLLQKRYKAELDPAKAGFALFTDCAAALALIPKPAAFFESIYRGWAIHLAMGCPFFDLRDYLDEETLMTLWGGTDARYLNGMSFPDAAVLLKEMLACADAALDGGSVCADLRYGHDNMLLPMLSLLGLSPWPFTFEESNSVFDCASAVPMASNMQMVFYKNRRDEVLVKILYNERERILPGLKPVTGPYYDWNELKKFFSNLITNK